MLTHESFSEPVWLLHCQTVTLGWEMTCLFAAVLLRNVMSLRHRVCIVRVLGVLFVVSLLAGIAGVAVSVLSFVSGSRD